MTAAPASTSSSATDATARPPVTFAAASDAAVHVAFTGRGDGRTTNLSLVVGDGDVHAARRAALSLVGGRPERAVFMQQVHGGDVAVVGAEHAGRGARRHDDAIAAVDALVTHACDLALVVLVADCVPVVLVDPGAGIAVAHAGRRGVQRSVVGAALRRLDPADAGRVEALVGPAIRGCCYEVPVHVAEAVTSRWPAAAATTSRGTPSLDLPTAVVEQLRAAGVTHVEQVGGCTRCSGDDWFSHRATVQHTAAPGRQAAIVVRRGGAPPAAPRSSAYLQSR